MRTHAEAARGAAATLRTLYLEPTTRCNLRCRACVRTAWDLPQGDMDRAVFDQLLAGLQAADVQVRMVLAGFGEPLSHPEVSAWVGRASRAGHRVELVTNGTLLTPHLARALAQAGLAGLWVSLDGAKEDVYSDARQGGDFPDVVANLRAFGRAAPQTELGIAFVATRHNLAELPAVAALARDFGAAKLHLSHVQAHSAPLARDALYPEALGLHEPSWRNPLTEARCGQPELTVVGAVGKLERDTCPFLQRDALSVRWDGAVAPCPELLHHHGSYLCGGARRVRPYLLGNIEEISLPELLADAEFFSFRQRLRAFDFAPCTHCGACPMYLDNESDCLESAFPSCAGCLWAQGLIRCP